MTQQYYLLVSIHLPSGWFRVTEGNESFKLLRRGLGLSVSPVTPPTSSLPLLMFSDAITITTKGKPRPQEHNWSFKKQSKTPVLTSAGSQHSFNHFEPRGIIRAYSLLWGKLESNERSGPLTPDHRYWSEELVGFSFLFPSLESVFKCCLLLKSYSWDWCRFITPVYRW